MTRFSPLRGIAMAAMILSAPYAMAADAAVFVQGEQFAITSADVQADALMRMPPEMQSAVLANAKTVGQIASNLYVRRAWSEQAVAAGVDKDPKVAAMLRLARDKVLSDAWLARIDQQSAPTDAAALDMAHSIYRAKPERFKVAEQVHARHILIAGETPEARARAEELLKQLKAGADFAKLAAESSDDKGSAARGGDLGFFEKARMVPEFGEAAFALQKKGDLSGVVHTKFGYHLIELEERRPAVMRTFDEVKDELVKEVRTSVAQQARVASAQKLEQSAKTDNDAIAAFAAAHTPVAPAAGSSPQPPAAKK